MKVVKLDDFDREEWQDCVKQLGEANSREGKVSYLLDQLREKYGMAPRGASVSDDGEYLIGQEPYSFSERIEAAEAVAKARF